MSIVSGIVGAIAGKKGADAQASAARDAAGVQRYMFDQTREDTQPFLNTGTNALSVLSNELGLSAFRPNQLGLGVDDFDYYKGAQWNDQATLLADLESLRDQGLDGNDRYKQGMRRLNLLRAGVDPNQQVAGFTETPGYQFQMEQGTRAIDASAAARGMTRSGATLKAQNAFGQGIAAQEYGNYLSRLGAVAGGGQGAASTLGSLGAQSAANQGNALMAGGQARASGYQAIGQGVQQGIQGIGQVFGYGQGQGWFNR